MVEAYISALYWKFLFGGVPMFDNTLQIRTGFALVHFYHMSLYTGLCPMCKPIWIKSGRALTSSISAEAEALGTTRNAPTKYCRPNVWLFLVLSRKFDEHSKYICILPKKQQCQDLFLFVFLTTHKQTIQNIST